MGREQFLDSTGRHSPALDLTESAKDKQRNDHRNSFMMPSYDYEPIHAIVARFPHTVSDNIDQGGYQENRTRTMEIAWVRRPQARVLLRHGGKILKEVSTYVDVGRFLTCIESGIEECVRCCEFYAIDTNSTLECYLEVTITDRPGIDLGDAPFLKGRRQINFDPRVHRLEPRMVTQAIVWSSMLSDEENLIKTALFRKEAEPLKVNPIE